MNRHSKVPPVWRSESWPGVHEAAAAKLYDKHELPPPPGYAPQPLLPLADALLNCTMAGQVALCQGQGQLEALQLLICSQSRPHLPTAIKSQTWCKKS